MPPDACFRTIHFHLTRLVLAAPPDPIIEDLRGLLQGEARGDELTRALYATDASVLRALPRAVVFPAGEDDVCAVLGYAHERGIPVHPRGAGTGIAGGCLGSGLTIDMSRHRPALPAPESDAANVPAGARQGELAAALAKQGRWFPPQSRQPGGTLGGMLASDAAGPWSVRCGRTRDHVLAVRMALADGRIVDARREPAPPPGSTEPHAALRREVAGLLAEHAEDIRLEQPETLVRPGGLHLRGALLDGTLDLPRLLVGSDGTLGVFLSARVSTVLRPPHRGMLLACYRRFGDALDAAVGYAEFDPRACEVFDRRLLALARQADERLRGWTNERAEALLLVETEGAGPANVAERLARLAVRAGTAEVVALADPADLEQAWRALLGAAARLGRRDRAAAPLEIAEGCAVPPAQLPEFFRRVRALLQERQVTATFAARPASGQLLLRPLIDLRQSESRYALPELCESLAAAARSLGGTFHAEDAAGLLRAGMLPAQFPRLQVAFRRLKRAFDPHGILNPGRLSEAASGFPLDLLRNRPTGLADSSARIDLRELPLLDVPDPAGCNGCGACRDGGPAVRMCPSFKADPAERSSPRALANVLRRLSTGELDPERLAPADLRTLAGNCVDCRMCRVECPAGVDLHGAESIVERRSGVDRELARAALRASAVAADVNCSGVVPAGGARSAHIHRAVAAEAGADGGIRGRQSAAGKCECGRALEVADGERRRRGAAVRQCVGAAREIPGDIALTDRCTIRRFSAERHGISGGPAENDVIGCHRGCGSEVVGGGAQRAAGIVRPAAFAGLGRNELCGLSRPVAAGIGRVFLMRPKYAGIRRIIIRGAVIAPATVRRRADTSPQLKSTAECDRRAGPGG